MVLPESYPSLKRAPRRHFNCSSTGDSAREGFRKQPPEASDGSSRHQKLPIEYVTKFLFLCYSAAKFLVFHFCGRNHQFTVLNSLGSDQFSCDLMDFITPAADHDYLKAIVLIQMDMQARIHCDLGFVLHVR